MSEGKDKWPWDNHVAVNTPKPPPLPPSRAKAAASTAWKVTKWIGVAILALIGLALLLAFLGAFPGFSKGIATTVLLFALIYVVTCIISTSKKIDALHAELRELRYDLNDLKNRL